MTNPRRRGETHIRHIPKLLNCFAKYPRKSFLNHSLNITNSIYTSSRMSPSQKPTVMFVHGAWHRPKHFERVSKLLNEQGFPTSLTANASVGGPRTANLYDDAKVVRTELDKLVVEEQKEVIVVLHSYGGIVGTQAVDVSLSRRVRKADGLAGGVLQLVYMSAFLLPLGKSPVTPVDGDVPAAFGAKVSVIRHLSRDNILIWDIRTDTWRLLRQRTCSTEIFLQRIRLTLSLFSRIRLLLLL